MREYNSAHYLFSLHIPKCSGTSFTEVLKKWFWPGFHAHYFRHETNQTPFKPRQVKLLTHKLGIFPLCIHGHFEEEAGVFECYPGASQFITIIRDPLELQISLFYDHKRRLNEQGELYWKGNKVELEYPTIDSWVANRPSFLLKFFPWKVTTDNYQEVIHDNFIFIGVTENLQQSVNQLAKKLGKPLVTIPHLNTSARDEKPSDEAIKQFKEKHKLEYLIYDYVCQLNN
jgi:hypothetical protein